MKRSLLVCLLLALALGCTRQELPGSIAPDGVVPPPGPAPACLEEEVVDELDWGASTPSGITALAALARDTPGNRAFDVEWSDGSRSRLQLETLPSSERLPLLRTRCDDEDLEVYFRMSAVSDDGRIDVDDDEDRRLWSTSFDVNPLAYEWNIRDDFMGDVDVAALLHDAADLPSTMTVRSPYSTVRLVRTDDGWRGRIFVEASGRDPAVENGFSVEVAGTIATIVEADVVE